ncbi:MAG: hypothetical protein K6G11_08630 [Lachnospiraceae bacterium]|nr:hypothetical protein [Lachnospiraceae bacterium]
MSEKNKDLALKILPVVICLIVLLVSFFGFGPKMEKVETYEYLTEKLDHKRESVIEISGGMIGLSLAVGMVPGDATTPIATQITELNNYLVISIGAIMLEKFLLPIIGFIVFRIMIPVVAVLCGVGLFFSKKTFTQIGIRIGIIAFAFLALIPAGIVIGEKVDDAFGLEKAVDNIVNKIDEIDMEGAADESTDESAEDESFFDKIKNWGSDVAENITEGGAKILEKAKVILGELMDVVAILLVTSCIIPVGVIIAMIAIIKGLFAILFKWFPLGKDK